jgi:uncharacterized repeat protein (TIGR01451 family)
MLTLPPPTINSGDILNFTLSVEPDITDQFPYNNTCERVQAVVNSYDPNDKLVAQGEEVHIDDIDEYFVYTIRFQNTGTASAINVRITDDLSDKLDWNTLTPIRSSHQFDAQLTNGNHLEILFENIDLPAQQDDDEGSNGYFIFKIKPKNDLVVGDVIDGYAQIYFDFNAPIITNTVSTEIVDFLSVEDFDLKTVSIFPNPTSEILNINAQTPISKVSLYDLNGRLLKEEQINGNLMQHQLDVQNLSNGIYFVEIDSGDKSVSKKFVKR